MKYKSHKPARLYFVAFGKIMRQKFVGACNAVKSGTVRGARLVALWWQDSLQYRYLRYRYMDFVRTFSRIPRNTYTHAAICLCSLMGLGFITTSSPTDETPNYYLRVSLNRPQITPLQEPTGNAHLMQETLQALRAAGLTPENNAWFAAGATGPLTVTGSVQTPPHRQSQGWNSSGGLLGISGGQVVVHTVTGLQSIAAMGQVPLQINSTPLPQSNLRGVAAGSHNPESLLAELGWHNEAAVPKANEYSPGWTRGGYGATVFSGPPLHWNGALMPEAAATGLNPTQSGDICRLDRMETASWLTLLRLENITGASSREPSKYREYVERFSGHYALSPSLVYAIMRVESSFNPVAVSSANALGLMQVVPQTAGGEVHAYLTGKHGIPRPELLFTPESNIQYGTTYLHLLRDRHFKDVQNPLSREICIVAAYNCGPNPVYRVFNRNKERALEQINRLTPNDLYARLVRDLPSQETREYLPKVIGARNDFLRGSVKF